MPRLPEIDETKLSPDQRKIYDEIKRVRGQVRGPFAVWLRNAELAECTLKLQDLFASRVQLERRLVQLMILISARLATAQFAWFVHAPHALKLGISPDIVEAIRERRTPEFHPRRRTPRLRHHHGTQHHPLPVRSELQPRHGDVRRTEDG